MKKQKTKKNKKSKKRFRMYPELEEEAREAAFRVHDEIMDDESIDLAIRKEEAVAASMETFIRIVEKNPKYRYPRTHHSK